MKKIVGLILIFMVIMSLSITAFASDPVLGDGTDDNTTTITGNEYENAQKNDVEEKDPTLPQTGSQEYVAAILFVVFAAGAIFAHKKVRDYRDI